MFAGRPSRTLIHLTLQRFYFPIGNQTLDFFREQLNRMTWIFCTIFKVQKINSCQKQNDPRIVRNILNLENAKRWIRSAYKYFTCAIPLSSQMVPNTFTVNDFKTGIAKIWLRFGVQCTAFAPNVFFYQL